MTCMSCGRVSAPCPETGYDADDLCPTCAAEMDDFDDAHDWLADYAPEAAKDQA